MSDREDIRATIALWRAGGVVASEVWEALRQEPADVNWGRVRDLMLCQARAWARAERRAA